MMLLFFLCSLFIVVMSCSSTDNQSTTETSTMVRMLYVIDL